MREEFRREKDVFGEEHWNVYEDGKFVGELKREERGGILGFGGEPVTVRTDAEGKETGYTKHEQGTNPLPFFPDDPHQGGFAPDGTKLAETRTETEGIIFPKKVLITRDAKTGEEISRSHFEVEKKLFEPDRRVKVTERTRRRKEEDEEEKPEPEPRRPAEEGDWVIVLLKIGIPLAIAGALIYTAYFTLLIWGGCIVLGLATGWLQAILLAQDRLEGAPVTLDDKGRAQLGEGHLRALLPPLWAGVILAAGVLAWAGLSSWLVWRSLPRIEGWEPFGLAVAALAGSVGGVMLGRREAGQRLAVIAHGLRESQPKSLGWQGPVCSGLFLLFAIGALKTANTPAPRSNFAGTAPRPAFNPAPSPAFPSTSSSPASPRNEAVAPGPRASAPVAANPPVAARSDTGRFLGVSPTGSIRIEEREMPDVEHRLALVLIEVANPSNSAVLYRFSRSAKVLFSPTERMLVVNDVPGSEGTRAQLFIRRGNVTYDLPLDFDADSGSLWARAWRFYLLEHGLGGTADPNHISITAKEWSGDGSQIVLMLARSGSRKDELVAEPWLCQFEVERGVWTALTPRLPGPVPGESARLESGSRSPSGAEAELVQVSARALELLLEREQKRQAEWATIDYGDQVAYYDSGLLDREGVLAKKRGYYRHWPVFQETNRESIRYETQSDGSIRATFRANYLVRSNQRGEEVTGSHSREFRFQIRNGRAIVVAENSATHSRDRRIFDATPSAGARSTAALVGERYPDTRLRFLRSEEIQSLNVDDLRYALNEMIARHGADFNAGALRETFQRFGWYQRIPGRTADQIEQSLFSPIELQNFKLLGERRNELRTRR